MADQRTLVTNGKDQDMNDHTEVQVDELPACDLCNDGTLATYDAKTKLGPWGNLCERHFQRDGIGLGLGQGQRLVVRGE